MSDDFIPWPPSIPPTTTRERIKIPNVDVVKCHTRKWVVYRTGGRPEIVGYIRRHELLGNFWVAPSSDGRVTHGQRWSGPFPNKVSAVERMISDDQS